MLVRLVPLMCLFALLAAPAHAALLAYTLSSELMKPGCSYDGDGDCLDDMLENQLAQAAAPLYFYDEDEDCSGGQSSLHYARRDFFQVRTMSPALTLWHTSGTVKRVRVTYFLLHPHDCQSWLGWGGHQGDSEKVEFTFYSYDLKTWYLEKGRYYHHNSPYHDFSGDYLARLASQLGVPWASVAGDEDGHGSWPGESASYSACAGPEDESYNDCFVGTMSEAYRNGDYEYVSAYRNIGGPPPERWNNSVLTVSADGHAKSYLDVGHAIVPEYWTYASGYQRFCGWECSASRQSDGNCSSSTHSESSCSSGLHEKVDRTQWALTACGDGACNGSESCSSCPTDCGTCPYPYCGDNVCQSDEDCSSCESDCGSCDPGGGTCLLPSCP